jgi:putative transposase
VYVPVAVLIHRGFKYRCYPTPEQVALLDDWQGKQRFLWNAANAQYEHVGARCKVDRRRGPSAFDQIYELTGLRAEYPWLREVPQGVQQQLLVELNLAWQRFFKGIADRPQFKCKGRDRAPVIGPNPKSFRIEGEGRKRHVVFPKLGRLAIICHREPVGKMSQCAISRDGDAWYVSIGCAIEVDTPPVSTKPIVAYDRGITNTIACSDGTIVKNPKHAELAAKRTKRLQRAASRKKKGSNNQKKAYARAARAQRKVKRQRTHFLHVESKKVAKNHGVVIFEKLNLKNMTKSAKGTVENPGRNVSAKSALNRGLLGAALGEFKRMVAYKIVLEGGRIVEVPPAWSSQTCAECDHVDAASRKGERFCCAACGHTDHADVNAARVLLARGMLVLAVEPTVNVCGDAGARGRSTKQKLRVVRRGTRRSGEAKATPLATG